jgi:hypothetical protein
MSIKSEEISKLKESWQQLAKDVDGEFYFKELITAHVKGPIYQFKILSSYKNIQVAIQNSLIDLGGLQKIHKSIDFKSLSNSSFKLDIYTWKLDIFDKLLNFKRTKTGNPDIDKNIGISGNDKEITKTLFNDYSIQQLISEYRGNLFLKSSDNELSLILSIPGSLIVSLPGRYDINLENLKAVYSKYLGIIDKLVSMKIWTTN